MKNIKKKSFTLIELLIVIAIIGILFIVLVSSVNMAIDKAKTAGVQTDFRSFQYAIEQVAREYDGFTTIGWDTGDINGDRICNSYDENDTNKNGICDNGEASFTGHITNKETWTGIYTLINPADQNDNSAILALQDALNKYLDPELKIRIDNDGKITMMNGMKDPWNSEYEGLFLTNASAKAAEKWNTDASMAGSLGDGQDRGAILIWSKGPNGTLGTKSKIESGKVTSRVSMIDANTSDNNIAGKDDLVMSVVYSFVNGYGQTGTQTQGFSSNQKFLSGHHSNIQINNGMENSPDIEQPDIVPENPSNKDETDMPSQDGTNNIPDYNNGTYTQYDMLSGEHKVVSHGNTWFQSAADMDKFLAVRINGQIVDPSNYTVSEGSTIIELTQEYVNTLNIDADHHPLFEILSTDGWAECTMEIGELTPLLPGKTELDRLSWDSIKELSSKQLSIEDLETYYNIHIGDTKTVNDTIYTLVSVDNEYGGFVFMWNTNKREGIENSNTNRYGYGSSDMAKYMDELYEDLNDEELKTAIKKVTIKHNEGSDKPTLIYEHECYMFLASHREVGGMEYENQYGNVLDKEGKVFEYFTSDEIRDAAGGQFPKWWLRTANPESEKYYLMVHNGRLTFDDQAKKANTVVAFFVI